MALDHEGLHEDAPSAISVIGGTRVDPLHMRPEDVNVRHIAHALARQCRYNGHVGHFLSVARHSIWVSQRCKPHGPQMQMWGLLHDAGEAYIGDMVKPLKYDPSFAVFREVEERLDAVIAEAFDLPFPMPAEVKEADRFVTVEVELGIRLRDSHDTTYQQDQGEFLARYYDLKTEMGGQ